MSPCHHATARPWFADLEGLQICRVAAKIFDNQSRTADKGDPPAWVVGDVLTTHHHRKERACFECYTDNSKLDEFLEIHRQREKRILDLEHGMFGISIRAVH